MPRPHRQGGDWSNPILRIKPLRWAIRRWLLLRGKVRVRAGGMTAFFQLKSKSDFHFLVALGGRCFEREQIEAVLSRLRPEDIIYEVGGHVGTWSVFMAKRVPRGHLHVFEPDAFNSAHLRANLALNGVTNATHHPLAASNAAGEADFGLSGSKGAGVHSLVIGTQHAQVIKVRTLRLDAAPAELHIPPPQVLKIDCEGAEGLVLDGADKLLEPGGIRLIFLEVHHDRVEKTGYTRERVIEMVSGRGFRTVQRWDRDSETLVLFER